MERANSVSAPSDDLSHLLSGPSNTPMESIDVLIEGDPATIHLKMESQNPTGSVKDRTAYGLIRALESQGRLYPGSVVVESTSGNLGVALGYLCQMRGYRFVAVVDPKTTQENLAQMQTLGAQIEMVEQPDATGGYLLSRLQRVRALCERNKHFVWTDQYANPANPLIHYQRTGPEIYAQMQGNVDALFLAVSTGGTLAGISRFFRAVSPSTRIIGVDAHGSVIFGTPPAPRKLTGIGSSRPSSFITREMYDSYIPVRDEEAFTWCRVLWHTTGIKVGGSSGAVLSACARYLYEHPTVTNVVCLVADDGEKYAHSIYSDEWIHKQGLDLSIQHVEPVQHIAASHTTAVGILG